MWAAPAQTITAAVILSPHLRAKDPCSSFFTAHRKKLPRSFGLHEPGLRMTDVCCASAHWQRHLVPPERRYNSAGL